MFSKYSYNTVHVSSGLMGSILRKSFWSSMSVSTTDPPVQPVRECNNARAKREYGDGTRYEINFACCIMRTTDLPRLTWWGRGRQEAVL
jgi:hypothetical protein